MKTKGHYRLLNTWLKGVVAVAILFSSFGHLTGSTAVAPGRTVSVEWVWWSRSLKRVQPFRFSFDQTLLAVRQARITKWILRYVEQQIATAYTDSLLRSLTIAFPRAHEPRMLITISNDDYPASLANE